MKPLYWFCYTLSGAIARIAFQYRAYGQENIIEEGPAIMAANHQSYLDPPLVGITCRNELHFLARKTLFEKKLLGPLISRVNALPVDLSRGDLTAFRAVVKLLKEGHRTVIFPEGTRSLNGAIQQARPGIGMIIAKTLAPVVPVRIFGSFEAWPKGGKIRPRPITVVVGKPIHFQKEDFASSNREAYQKASERVLAAIAAIEKPK
ncbi:MAG: 1-acyl-sn-glycerol-3-phosphate acyltransferase [Verrucomicrobiota bacterium]|jgi:1-acyl-sn-glycerol-3-phosphate acyltransferase|nr:1-acyl-sn-glycerol-3-phosphate acyltransferase [Verrucomicrobiota bacterium]